MMDRLILNESMRVGHGQVDAEHALLIGIVNQCVDLVAASATAEEFHEVLVELRSRLNQHIVKEEAIMVELGYLDIEGERKEHKNGLLRLNQLIEHCREGANLEVLLREVTGLLLLIFIKSDMSFKSFLQSIDYQDEATAFE